MFPSRSRPEYGGVSVCRLTGNMVGMGRERRRTRNCTLSILGHDAGTMYELHTLVCTRSIDTRRNRGCCRLVFCTAVHQVALLSIMLVPGGRIGAAWSSSGRWCRGQVSEGKASGGLRDRGEIPALCGNLEVHKLSPLGLSSGLAVFTCSERYKSGVHCHKIGLGC